MVALFFRFEFQVRAQFAIQVRFPPASTSSACQASFAEPITRAMAAAIRAHFDSAAVSCLFPAAVSR